MFKKTILFIEAEFFKRRQSFNCYVFEEEECLLFCVLSILRLFFWLVVHCAVIWGEFNLKTKENIDGFFLGTEKIVLGIPMLPTFSLTV